MSGESLKIAVDCDDVIANISDGVRLFVNETQGFDHSPEDYSVTGEYRRYWERVWGIPEGESVDRFLKFVQSGRMAHLDPVPGALETLHELKESHSLVMVTARSELEVEFTEQWLASHAPDLFEEVTYMHRWKGVDGEKMTKADICRELEADCLIDDSYDHCRLMAEVGRRALLFGDYGWNRARPLHENMVRVIDWHAVREVLARA